MSLSIESAHQNPFRINLARAHLNHRKNFCWTSKEFKTDDLKSFYKLGLCCKWWKFKTQTCWINKRNLLVHVSANSGIILASGKIWSRGLCNMIWAQFICRSQLCLPLCFGFIQRLSPIPVLRWLQQCQALPLDITRFCEGVYTLLSQKPS